MNVILKELTPFIRDKKADELAKLYPEEIVSWVICQKVGLIYNYYKLHNYRKDSANDAVFMKMVDRVNRLALTKQMQSEDPTSKLSSAKIKRIGNIPNTRNLNEKQYLDNPAIGREQELENLMVSLLTDKKSPILVGPPGTGKNAIVESLAYLLKNDQVPTLLKGKQIIEIDTLSLISGTIYRGQFEEKLQKIIDIAKKDHDIILFIDEIHTVMGLGTSQDKATGMSDILKPYLSSGEITIIGATTPEEYEDHLTKDKAFQRRYEKITVAEPDPQTLKEILQSKISYLEQIYQMKFPFTKSEQDTILDMIISATDKKYRLYNTPNHNPDIAIKILTKAFAIAALLDHNEVTKEDIIAAFTKIDDLNTLACTRHAHHLEQCLEKETVKEKTRGAKIIQFPKNNQ